MFIDDLKRQTIRTIAVPAFGNNTLRYRLARIEKLKVFGSCQELMKAGLGNLPEGEIEKLGEISDLQVDGDTATAQSRGETIKFKKIDGEWKLDIKREMAGDDEGGGDEPDEEDGEEGLDQTWGEARCETRSAGQEAGNGFAEKNDTGSG